MFFLPFFLLSSASASWFVHAVAPEFVGNTQVQWQILTKLNYSSQIRLHPHILLMITVPWSGESQSLMKDLGNVITNKQEKYGMLKLMVLYRNNEKMLADALNATEGITILFYHYSLSFKYKGKLRVQNILLSAHYLIKAAPNELPLTFLNSAIGLRKFLKSTDKAFLLFEFCGWTSKLLSAGRKNWTQYVFDDFSGESFNGEPNEVGEGEKEQNMLHMLKEDKHMKCDVDDGFNTVRWHRKLNWVSASDSERARANNKWTCSFEEFQRFETFLSRLITVAREFFLPPERLRFGLIQESSLLSLVGVRQSSSWLMMLYFAACPGCSMILTEENDLKNVLHLQAPFARELEDFQHDYDLVLPFKKPTILLFIDRSSNSSKLRRRSREALATFRDLASHHQVPNQINRQKTAILSNFPDEFYQVSRSIFEHPRLELTSTFQGNSLKDKRPSIITNERVQLSLEKYTSGLDGSSLHEIMAYVLRQKEIKLSTLASGVGFQLLSDDVDIKHLTQQVQVESNNVLGKISTESVKKRSENLKADQMCPSDGENKEESTVLNPDKINSRERATFDTDRKVSLEPKHHYSDEIPSRAKDRESELKTISLEEKAQENLNLGCFGGSFFFLDGQCWLLEILTSKIEVPAAVIIDPVMHNHYVFPEKTVLNFSSLSEFIDRFTNGSLLPYQQSKYFASSSSQASNPSFVNTDFHELESIPQITSHMFSEMVLGNQLDSVNASCALEKDVLVLFSNSWCGFCLKMELVVHEVYHAIESYSKMLKNVSGKEGTLLNDDLRDAGLKLPVIYLMDCVLNDCSLILQTIVQKELYPSLILFPAESKNAVSYGGDASVSDIITFIADHGTNSQSLIRGNGFLWTGAERGGKNQYLVKETNREKEQNHKIF